MIGPPQIRAITNRVSLIHQVSAQCINELTVYTTLVFFLSHKNFLDFENTIEWSPRSCLVPQPYIPHCELDIAKHRIFVLCNGCTIIEWQISDKARVRFTVNILTDFWIEVF